MSLQAILEYLPKLSPDELLEVRQRVLALTALDGVKATDDWLLQGILNLLEERGLGETIPENFRITNRRQFHGYLPKAEKIRKTMELSCPWATKLDRIALGRLLARCLAEYINEFRQVNLNAMLQHVDMSLSALENSFPDYRRAGLLRVVIRPKRER